MEALRYFTRTPVIEYIKKNRSDTAVVFLHGILSETKKAFKLDREDGFFWDKIKNIYPFDGFDLIIFSYGRVDLSNLIEIKNPINTLSRISEELHGYIEEYRNIIFIGHSQGGLLAKVYATKYYMEQGIFLTTLHTPHRNKSFSVMRSTAEKLWIEEIRFVVPHLFCASVNDRKIVKPDNAFYGGIDDKYLSKDERFKSLGHSHLSSHPDEELIFLLKENIFKFINSGHSRSHAFSKIKINENLFFNNNLEIVFSRSKRRLSDYASNLGGEITNLWQDKLFISSDISRSSMNRNDADSQRLILIEACSVNYFTRCISSKKIDFSALSTNEIDKGYGCSRDLTNNYLCELSFNENWNEKNPYCSLAFDAYYIRKKFLIDDKDFIDFFCSHLIKNKLTLSASSRLSKTHYFQELNSQYIKCANNFQRKFIDGKYVEFPSRANVGISSFSKIVKKIVYELIKLQEKKNPYQTVFKIMKSSFYESQKKFTVLDAEYLISWMMRSDGELYWLDKNLKIMHRLELPGTKSRLNPRELSDGT